MQNENKVADELRDQGQTVAEVLFLFLGLLLSPMIASAAMTFSSVSVILNALRLRNLKL